jgi:hypothetical protein
MKMRELSMEEAEFVSGGGPGNIYWDRYTRGNNPFGSLEWDTATSGGEDGWTLPNGESLGT